MPILRDCETEDSRVITQRALFLTVASGLAGLT